MTIIRIISLRILTALLVLLMLSGFLFTAIETLPGDFASASAPRYTTGEQIAFSREEMGLNVNPVTRYANWMTGAVQGNFGISWYSRQDIAPMLSELIGNTMMLAGLAAMMAFPLGFFLAVLSVIFRGGLLDRGVTALSLAVISMPEFLIAYLLMTIFVVTIPIFPAHTIFYDGMDGYARLYAMILPAVTLAIVALAPVIRMTRASLMDVLSNDYVMMARLKGASVWRVMIIHALPNALPPIINIFVLVTANFMVGAFIVEQIFSYPGIGKAMITAVKFRDIPLVLAIGMVFAVFFIGLNLIADIISILVTPRARFPRK